jgi:hypothetical protein
MSDQELNEEEASRYLFAAHGLKIAKRTLTNLRVSGTGPVFRRIGRFVVYAKADLAAYAAKRISPPMATTKQEAELARPPRTDAEAEALIAKIEAGIAELNAWIDGVRAKRLAAAEPAGAQP